MPVFMVVFALFHCLVLKCNINNKKNHCYTQHVTSGLLPMQSCASVFLKNLSACPCHHLCAASILSSPHRKSRLTWTRTHQYVVWCYPGESDAGSCICRGLPSHCRRGSGHWGSFYSRLQLRPTQCSGTEREQRRTMSEALFRDTL